MALSLPLKHRTVHWGRAETVSPVAGKTDSSDSFQITTSDSDGYNGRGDSSCISALSLEPSGRWAEYSPKPWADYTPTPWGNQTPAGFEYGKPAKVETSMSNKINPRKKPPEISLSFPNEAGTPAVSVCSGPSTTTSSTTKSPHRMVTFDATPTPWGDSATLGFGYSMPSSRPGTTKTIHRVMTFDATPTPWADSALIGFGIDAQEAPQTLSEKAAAKGWNLPQGVAHVPVKRTFIDGLPEELPELEQPSLLRTNSAPTLIGARPTLFPPSPHRVPPSRLGSNDSTPRPPPGLEFYVSKEPLHIPMNEMVLANVTNTEPMPSGGGVHPSGSGNDWSIGSVEHGNGNCKPCAWFHKSKGCFRGWECRHCHACAADELSQRKKGKVAMLKEQAKAEKRVREEAQSLYLEAQRLMHRAHLLSSQAAGAGEARPLTLSNLV